MAGKNDLTVQEIIRRKLDALDTNFDKLDSRTIKQLERLEVAIQAEEDRVSKARATLRGRGYTLNTMSAVSGISRATFYNKPLLADYVELSKSEVIDDTEICVSKVELDEAKRKINQMMERDGELVLALADNERLEKRVAALESVLADRTTHFEGMPRTNIVRLTRIDSKEDM